MEVVDLLSRVSSVETGSVTVGVVDLLSLGVSSVETGSVTVGVVDLLSLGAASYDDGIGSGCISVFGGDLYGDGVATHGERDYAVVVGHPVELDGIACSRAVDRWGNGRLRHVVGGAANVTYDVRNE